MEMAGKVSTSLTKMYALSKSEAIGSVSRLFIYLLLSEDLPNGVSLEIQRRQFETSFCTKKRAVIMVVAFAMTLLLPPSSPPSALLGLLYLVGPARQPSLFLPLEPVLPAALQ